MRSSDHKQGKTVKKNNRDLKKKKTVRISITSAAGYYRLVPGVVNTRQSTKQPRELLWWKWPLVLIVFYFWKSLVWVGSRRWTCHLNEAAVDMVGCTGKAIVSLYPGCNTVVRTILFTGCGRGYINDTNCSVSFTHISTTCPSLTLPIIPPCITY